MNAAYFGKVPAERLAVGERAVFFRGDGRYRSKIGLSPGARRPVLGSYDARDAVLTLVQFDRPRDARDYVNSMWEVQKEPLRGRRGEQLQRRPARAGSEAARTVLRARDLFARGRAARGRVARPPPSHDPRRGGQGALDAIARQALGASLDAITSALPAATSPPN